MIHIWECDYVSRPDLIHSRIKNILGIYDKKILEAMKDQKEYIAEKKQDTELRKLQIEQLTYVKHYLNFLDDIIESVEYEEHMDYKNYLYVGIEVGNPTVDDIVR